MSENVAKRMTPRQRKALTALLAGARWKEAAAVAGVSERTVHRWREQEAFAFELQRLSAAAVKEAAIRLSGTVHNRIRPEMWSNESMPGQRLPCKTATKRKWKRRWPRLISSKSSLTRNTH